MVDEQWTLTIMRQDGIQHWLDVGDCCVQVFANVRPEIMAISTEKSQASLVHDRLELTGQTAGRSTQSAIDLLTWNNWYE